MDSPAVPRIAEAAVEEAAAVDAAEDAAEAASAPAAPSGRVEYPGGASSRDQKAMERSPAKTPVRPRSMPLIRPVKALSSADRGRGSVVGSAAGGVDPIRLYQARIAREQQRLAPLLGVRNGTSPAAWAIRRVLRKAQAGLGVPSRNSRWHGGPTRNSSTYPRPPTPPRACGWPSGQSDRPAGAVDG